jgi:hypothetical protein
MKLACLVAKVTTKIQLSVAWTSPYDVSLCLFQLQQTSTETVAVRLGHAVSELVGPEFVSAAIRVE